MICLPAKQEDMADSNAFDGPVDVGSNEMFRRLRSAKPSHVEINLQCVGPSRTPTTEYWLCPLCKDKEPSGMYTETCS